MVVEHAWTYSVQEALRHYGVSPQKGLSHEQVQKGKREFGLNGTCSAGSCAGSNTLQNWKRKIQRRSGN